MSSDRSYSCAALAKILFCEDNENVRKLIGVAMRTTSHEVHLADDGDTGLELARQHHPDLVVTDLAMPRMSGLELHDALKSDPELARIKIAFLTASTQRNLVVQAQERSPQAILFKPFSPATLRDEVESLLGR
jgi:CheY-like chemotaxis protein